MFRRTFVLPLMGVMSLSLMIVGSARAAMTLTPIAVSEGFQLQTFADGFPHTSATPSTGPLGIGFESDGTVLVADPHATKDYRFPTGVSGQHVSGAVAKTAKVSCIAVFDGVIYATTGSTGSVVELNPNGTILKTLVTGYSETLGIVGDPLTGDLFFSDKTGNEIYQLDPTTKVVTKFAHVSAPDGLTLSVDSGELFAASFGADVVGFNVATKTENLITGSIPGADGVGVGTGLLAGNIYVNTNFGDLVQYNIATHVQTLFADGGSRGDYALADPFDQTFFLTQSSTVLRIIAPPGGGFGTPVIPVPAAVWTGMSGLLLVGLVQLHRRRRSQAAA